MPLKDGIVDGYGWTGYEVKRRKAAFGKEYEWTKQRAMLQCYHNPNTWSWVQASVLAKDARVGVGKAGTEQGGKGCKGCEVKSAKPVFVADRFNIIRSLKLD